MLIGTNKKKININLSNKLRKENKSNDLFEVMIGNLSLEELIALKLEISYRNIDKPVYGYSLYRNLFYVVQDAFLKFTFSICKTKSAMRLFLGLDKKDFKNILSKYEIEEYLLPKEKGDVNNNSSN